MNNQEYWEKRKAQQMFGYMEDAEKAARELTKLYLTASKDIQTQAKKVFNKYRSRYDLSRKEAGLLLSRAKDPTDIKQIIELLKDDPKNAELVKELESQAYGARIGHLNGLYNQLETVALSIYAAQQKRFYAALTKLAKKVYYNNIFDIQQYAGYGFDFKLLDQKNIEKVLNSKWSGINYSQRLWKNTEKLAKAVKKEIMLNLLTGRPLKDAAEAINNRFGAGYNESRRLIRTESCFVCNQMQRLSYENCGVEKYIYVAVLDLKTSLICRSLDKKAFPVKEATPGKNYPPMHPWCRSTTIAYISKELLHKLKQSAIDPATGKRIVVPGDMTYQEWYDKFVNGQSAIGKKGSKTVENSSENGIINEAKGSGTFQAVDMKTLSSKTNITIEEIKEEMSNSPIGRETLNLIEKSDVIIQLLQGVQHPAGARGAQQGNNITIYLDGIANKRIAAQTIIHEMTHYHYDIGNCQWAEAVCFAKEKMHIEGRNKLTYAELRYIVRLAKDNYGDLNWKKGGYRNGKNF